MKKGKEHRLRRKFAFPALLPGDGDPWSSALVAMLQQVQMGSIAITTPLGRKILVGDPQGSMRADMQLRSSDAAKRIILGGNIGLGEGYVAGQWDSSDLPGLLELLGREEPRMAASRGKSLIAWILSRLQHVYNDNSRTGSRRNIAFHYDLGNEFYRLWLDSTMTYSSAYWDGAAQTLEQAQRAKMRRVASHLDLQPEHRVLEIGCGWGGMAEYLTGLGADVVGVTLSRQQLAWAKRQLKDKADLRLQDYRDVEGEFDRLVSVEMIEAVGKKHWPGYFKTLHDRLKPGGVAVIQAITIAEDRFEPYLRTPDFIQRYIFPGGMVPTGNEIDRCATAAGLQSQHLDHFGASYARTLSIWRQRFLSAWPEIQSLGFDDSFRRLWIYYLSYCEAGFLADAIDVGIWRFQRTDTP